MKQKNSRASLKTSSKFSDILASVDSLANLALLDPCRDARNAKTIRRRKRAMKLRAIEIGEAAAKKEAARAKRARVKVAKSRAEGKKRNAAVLAKHKQTVNGIE